MAAGHCANNNHGKMNVTVKYCPDCGEVVGKNAAPRSCNAEVHARRRKERDKYCVDCGKPLG